MDAQNRLSELQQQVKKIYPTLVDELSVLLKLHRNTVAYVIGYISITTAYENWQIVDIMLDYQRCLNNDLTPAQAIEYLEKNRSYGKQMIQKVLERFEADLKTI